MEKLNLPNMDEAIFNMGVGVDRDWEACYDLTAPPCFALAAQAVEIYWQLRGEGGERQVQGAQTGLTHNNSGMGEHLVIIYGAE
ncbi:MAG: hypothetical protein ACE5JU_13410 [Candidatus Binatia bacterium]